MARHHDERARVRRPGAGRPRKQPRDSDRPVSEEIIGAASRLFSRRGVQATTMAEVAEASGLQVSSLYYYFRSKHEILDRIAGDVNRIPLEALADAVAAHDDPAVQLFSFIRSDAAALCTFPFDINEIHRLAEGDVGEFARYWNDRTLLVDRVRAVVEAGIDAGNFRPVDPYLTALTILANDEAAQNWFRPAGARPRPETVASYTPDTIGDHLADFALRALLADPGHIAVVRASAR